MINPFNQVYGHTHFHILFTDGVYNEDDFFHPVIPEYDDLQEEADDKSSDQHAIDLVFVTIDLKKGYLKIPHLVLVLKFERVLKKKDDVV